MKTLFDAVFRDELIQRIQSIDENRTPLWGKMSVYQMARHCTYWNDWVLGNGDFVYQQAFLGKLFGKMALRSNTRDDKPIGKKMPTGKAFKFMEKEGDLSAQKAIWKTQMDQFAHFSNDLFIHDFFGKMTREQIGIFAFKHNDHHLRQFQG